MDMPKIANVRVAGVREKRTGIIGRQVVWRGKRRGEKKGWKCMTPTFGQGGMVLAASRSVYGGTQY